MNLCDNIVLDFPFYSRQYVSTILLYGWTSGHERRNAIALGTLGVQYMIFGRNQGGGGKIVVKFFVGDEDIKPLFGHRISKDIHRVGTSERIDLFFLGLTGGILGRERVTHGFVFTFSG